MLTFSRPRGYVAIFEAEIGEKYTEPAYRNVVSKEKPNNIYNNISSEESEDYYNVKWRARTGRLGESNKLVMKETKNGEQQVSDEFIKNGSITESMENITTNVGIYFSNPVYLLGQEGQIFIYNDETDELVKTFTRQDWSNYNKDNPYMYEEPIKHIRIETTKTNINSDLEVTNIKELNDEYITNNFTKDEFDELRLIKTELVGYIDGGYVNTSTSMAYYDGPVSVAIIRFENYKGVISTQETSKNEKIIIETRLDNVKQEKEWTNGTFLVKFPKEIINLEINDVTINNPNVSITSYETYEKNESKFIKIYTSNEDPVGAYAITIDSNITCDPRIASCNRSLELYAKNENYENYFYYGEDIYDINSDENIIENVNKISASINLIAPNSLLTNQIAREFDYEGNICIAPNIAYTNKEPKTSIIDINLKNNYSNNISEIKVVGRVPKTGNKYVLNQREIGSTFDSNMSSLGIILPENLIGRVKLYYSENGEATQDLEDQSNGWTEEVTDWTKIKSYYIDFRDVELTASEDLTVSYKIDIPEGLNYNKVTYSDYAVFYNLNTDEGKLEQSTEPNKLGFMIAKLYELNIAKYQEDSEKKVQGAVYKITQEETGESKTQRTNQNGELVISRLLLEKTYEIEEIKTTPQYELNTNKIKFTTAETTDGKIAVTILEGNIRRGSTIRTEENSIRIEVEDRVKPNLRIIKYEKNQENKINKVKYLIKGKGIIARGKIINTNEEGVGEETGLFLNEEYTLEEVKADGYYLNEDIIK